MEMRAVEDLDMGDDLTPPLPPVAFVLRDSAVGLRCSSCFRLLPPCPVRPSIPSSSGYCGSVPNNAPTLLYCSPRCASLDSPLHYSSAEPQLLCLFLQSSPSWWEESSDLRLCLRLLHVFETFPRKNENLADAPDLVAGDQGCYLGRESNYGFQRNDYTKGAGNYVESQGKLSRNTGTNDSDLERIGGLMTNRERLIFQRIGNDRFGGIDERCEDSCDYTESLIKKIKEGAKLVGKARRICRDRCVDAEMEEFLLEERILYLVLTNAVEVQDESGCSIGVAVYGPTFSWINHSCSPNACYRFRLGVEHDVLQQPLRIAPATRKRGCGDDHERNGYGPRAIVRSIKAVDKGEEVTIAYTDLLQPKDTRQAELWLKYRFICCCQRCSALPLTYVDYALQTPFAPDPNCPESPDNEMETITESFDDVITEYLSFGDPKSCCEKLENLLCHGLLSDKPTKPPPAKPPRALKLNPFHYLCQNAYTTLSSAYKVWASDSLAFNYEDERQKLEEACNMYKTSAAFSLLLAGVVHHLSLFESSLVAPVANFFSNAGESLLLLGRSSLCPQETSSFSTKKCSRCDLTVEPNSVGPDEDLPLEEVKHRLFNCVADMTSNVWATLASQSGFLKLIRSPIEFRWLTSLECVDIHDSESSSSSSPMEFRVNLMLLGFHCLRYGAVFSDICYGHSVEMNNSL